MSAPVGRPVAALKARAARTARVGGYMVFVVSLFGGGSIGVRGFVFSEYGDQVGRVRVLDPVASKDFTESMWCLLARCSLLTG